MFQSASTFLPFNRLQLGLPIRCDLDVVEKDVRAGEHAQGGVVPYVSAVV